ncbi:Oidioi.mRNA.OKI2018_I69.PAR.g11467.t1.cds [Oikopleura dioica]|uniref:Oidioi.mRNA.OKI2018_I69.PAR.g11467.t1.cds n=1 Tax=Oikopleura dioica TaxID=34765 RepID=A0ABN7RVQ2_OIKDI|nr:Oidioi.mRNA.OKI2018_I69.PAR.g11467.t1.cds [Oikopleura dioica]
MVKRYVNLTLVLSTTLFVISVVKISLVSLKLELEDQFLNLSIALECVPILCAVIGFVMFTFERLFTLDSVVAPLLSLLSVVCNCISVGMSVYFFNTFVVGTVSTKAAYASFTSVGCFTSAALGYCIFTAQKLIRWKKARLSQSLSGTSSLSRSKRGDHPYYHSLIALNIHQYLKEQVAMIDPNADLSFLQRNRIMRIKNPSVVKSIKKKSESCY